MWLAFEVEELAGHPGRVGSQFLLTNNYPVIRGTPTPDREEKIPSGEVVQHGGSSLMPEDGFEKFGGRDSSFFLSELYTRRDRAESLEALS